MAVPARHNIHYDLHRYDGLADRAIAAELSRFVGVLLLRGRLQTLLARREIGGLFTEFARHHPKDRSLFEAFALNTVGLSSDEGRRHMQLWVYWPRCEGTLERVQARTTELASRSWSLACGSSLHWPASLAGVKQLHGCSPA